MLKNIGVYNFLKGYGYELKAMVWLFFRERWELLSKTCSIFSNVLVSNIDEKCEYSLLQISLGQRIKRIRCSSFVTWAMDTISVAKVRVLKPCT